MSQQKVGQKGGQKNHKGWDKMKQSDVFKLPDGKHLDAAGLYLFVRGDGKYRSWYFQMKIGGRRKTAGLGSATAVTLTAARLRAQRIRAAVASGKTWDEATGKTVDQAPESHLFRNVSEAALSNYELLAQYKDTATSRRVRQIISDYAMPALGSKDVAAISRTEIVEVLRPLWFDHSDTATRLRCILERILDYAVVQGWALSNPAVWKGSVSLFLPAPKKVSKTVHRDALSLLELKSVVAALRKRLGFLSSATLFGILTGTRVVEFCKARWDEIDEDAAVWSCSPDHRKGHHDAPFRVPLSRQALDILSAIPRSDSGYIFQGRVGAHIALGSPRLLLIKLASRKTTMHGCRSTFKDWAVEAGFPDHLSEKALSHVVGNEVERAYLRTDMLEQRRELMQAWADELFGDSAETSQ